MKLNVHKIISGLTILSILIFDSSAWAGMVESVNINKKYAIEISGSWNSLRNENLNDNYIETWISRGLLGDKINSGYGLKAGLIYRLSPRISIAAELSYISGASNKDVTVINYSRDDTTLAHDYVKTSLYAPSLCARYHIRKSEFDFLFGFSESLLFGKASRHHTSYAPFFGVDTLKNDFRSIGVGFRLFSGIQYIFTGSLSYTMEFGYRNFRTGDLIEKDTEMAMRPQPIYNTEPANLDYSGPYISAGLIVRLF